MTITSEIEDEFSVQLFIKGTTPSPHQWACGRFLGETELVALLEDRLDISDAEVRRVLSSYQELRPAGPAVSISS